MGPGRPEVPVHSTQGFVLAHILWLVDTLHITLFIHSKHVGGCVLESCAPTGP